MKIKKLVISAAMLLVLLIAACPFVSAASSTTISGGEVDGYIGAIVDVPINIAAGSKVAAGDLDITYDSTMLEYVSDVNGDASTGLGVGNLVEAGDFKFGLATNDPITEKGALVVIKFEVLSAATGNIAIKITASGFVDEDMKTITVNVENGKVSVSGEVKSDGTVVDNSGNVIGSKKDDGTIVDNNGSQIGVAATSNTKSEAAASAQIEESKIASAAEQNSGVAVESSAETSGSSFKIENWMIYTALGALFLAFIVIVIIMLIKQKKKHDKAQFDKYEKVYNDEGNLDNDDSSADESHDNK